MGESLASLLETAFAGDAPAGVMLLSLRPAERLPHRARTGGLTMGLFDWLRGKKMVDPVRGKAEITWVYADAASRSETQALFRSRKLRLQVTAEGMEPATVEWKGIVKATKGDRPGLVVPVTVDRANPDNLELHWDEVPHVGTQLKDHMESAKELSNLVGTDAIAELSRQWSAGEISQEEYLARFHEVANSGEHRARIQKITREDYLPGSDGAADREQSPG